MIDISINISFDQKLYLFKNCIFRQNGRGNPARRICRGQCSWPSGDNDDDDDDNDNDNNDEYEDDD